MFAILMQIAMFVKLSQTARVLPMSGIVQVLTTEDDLTEINRDISGLFEGDIVPRWKGRNALNFKRFLWSDAKVPIMFGSTIFLESIGAIEESITEFALQTCVNITYRTNEPDYVSIESLKGCWSPVGKRGGNQTLSLGNHCQYKRVAVHELLHAIGFYHEHSRRERDNYISIQLSNVKAGKDYNFDKLYMLDNMGFEYDFNSLMHYQDTAFSVGDSLKTILTKNPDLQDAISYPKDTLSDIDVAKVNRLYDCANPLLYSYHCGFDESTICGWAIHRGIWNWVDLSTRTLLTNREQRLPKVDGTHDKHFKGGYLYSTGNAILKSMMYKSKVDKQCLQLWYFVNTNSSVALNVLVVSIDHFTGEVHDVLENIILDSNVDARWTFFRRSISAPFEYRIMVTSRLNDDGFVAIDDFSVVDRPCDAAYFAFPSITSLIARAGKQKYETSTTAITEDGYSFKIRIYLNRTDELNQFNVMIFFNLVPGADDDNLNWPYKNRYVRLSVLDQHSNPLRAQHRTKAFLDTVRRRPLTGMYLGGKVMQTSSLFKSRQYLKHDTLIVGVSVKDMTSYIAKHGARTQSPDVDYVFDVGIRDGTTTNPFASTSTLPDDANQPTTDQRIRGDVTTTESLANSPISTTQEIESARTTVANKCTGTMFEKTVIYILVATTGVLILMLIVAGCALKRYRINNVHYQTKAAITTGIAGGVPRVEVFSVRNKGNNSREKPAADGLNSEYTVMSPATAARSPTQSVVIPQGSDNPRWLSSFSNSTVSESSAFHATSPSQRNSENTEMYVVMKQNE